MINKKLEAITVEDFKQLIENCISESRTLEYKAELNVNTGDERKEFLADVSAFANAMGGDLIYGIVEGDNNIPTEVKGIQSENTDELIRKIESLIRDCISPRISRLEIQAFHLQDSNFIFLIRIEKSFLAPHRVTYNGNDKFFSRNSRGKYAMDVNDLRTAFNSTLELTERVEQYKMNRINTIRDNEYKLLSEDIPMYILQVIPLSAFDYNSRYEIKDMEECMNKAEVTSFGFRGDKIINIDGIMKYTNESCRSRENGRCYLQLKKNGIVEAVTNQFFFPNAGESHNRIIGRKELVRQTILTIRDILKYITLLHIAPPIIVSISIINAFGYMLSADFYDSSYKVDRNNLMFDNIMIENLDVEIERILRPIFDDIWNACGYKRCMLYDENDKYIG